MKKLEIKWLDSKKETYANALFQMLSMPANNAGTSYEEMKTVVPLLEKLEAYEHPEVGVGQLLLEDAEWQKLSDRVKAFTGWGSNSRDLLEMCEEVFKAPNVEVGELGAAKTG
jgi:hypothetical protein